MIYTGYLKSLHKIGGHEVIFTFLFSHIIKLCPHQSLKKLEHTFNRLVSGLQKNTYRTCSVRNLGVMIKARARLGLIQDSHGGK